MITTRYDEISKATGIYNLDAYEAGYNGIGSEDQTEGWSKSDYRLGQQHAAEGTPNKVRQYIDHTFMETDEYYRSAEYDQRLKAIVTAGGLDAPALRIKHAGDGDFIQVIRFDAESGRPEFSFVRLPTERHPLPEAALRRCERLEELLQKLWTESGRDGAPRLDYEEAT